MVCALRLHVAWDGLAYRQLLFFDGKRKNWCAQLVFLEFVLFWSNFSHHFDVFPVLHAGLSGCCEKCFFEIATHVRWNIRGADGLFVGR